MTLKDLQALDHAERCKGTKMPPEYVPRKVFTDKTANGLENAICRFIQLHGGQAERIKNTGRAIDNTKTVTNILGQSYKIGSVDWIPGTGTKGRSDISAVIPIEIAGHKVGLTVSIEVKIGSDRPSLAQLKYAQDIINAGGVHWFVKTWPDFYAKYCELIYRYK